MENLCLCPLCGKKVKSKDLVFEFTGFIKERMKALILGGDTSKDVLSGLETFFNTHKFYESEEKLCALPRLNDQRDSSLEHEYCLPYEEIRKQIGYSTGVKSFKEWVESNIEAIVSQKYTLLLDRDKTGTDDKIRIDKVLYKDRDRTVDVARVRRCPDPECRGAMSYWAGRYKEISLTVLGGSRVSKSTTMTACIAAFMDQSEDICVQPSEEDASWLLFRDNYLRRYQSGIKIEPTDTQEDRIPKVSFRVRIKEKSIVLTFIDLPGEFDGINGISNEIYRRYEDFYKNIDFVWYCTDPGEVQQLTGSSKKLLGYEENQEIISTNKLASNMRNLSAFFGRAGRRIPVLYIVGKTDSEIIGEQDKADFDLYSPKDDDKYELLDIETFYRQARKTKEYIMKYNPEIVRTFEESFKDRAYVAVSAYGYVPENGSVGMKKKPYHCRIPLYWMLALRNCMEVGLTAKRGRRRQEYARFLKELDEDIREKAEYNLYMNGPYKI